MIARSNESSSIFQVNDNLIRSSRWLIAMGVAMLILGLVAFVSAVATTLLSVLMIGSMFLIASIFQLVFAVTSGRWAGFAVHLLVGVLYGITGAFLVTNPTMGAATLTLFLAYLFLASGLFRIVASVAMRFSGWGWSFISGVVTALVGVYVLLNLSSMTMFLLGTLFAIDLLFFGIHLTAFGIALRKQTTNRSSQWRAAS
jgi:uncharacterized membrane protein HdeD (DUF308 family)